jgi:predicted anti-sigma-YlaC factor YlaD
MTDHTHGEMSCEHILRALNEYVDGDTVSALCREFAEHLAGCNPCQLVVDNIRNTIRLYKDGEPYPMPAAFQERFLGALKAKWKAKFPDSTV